MQYFKVFRRQYDKSLTSSWATGAAIVRYEEGKLSEAPKWLAEKGYGVTVFSSLAEAVSYRRLIGGSNYSAGFPIYSVAIAGRVFSPGVMGSNHELRYGTLRPCSDKWPEGTMMADGIIPMREIAVAK